MGTFELEVVTHIYVKTTFCDDKTPPSLIPRTLDREGFVLYLIFTETLKNRAGM